MSVFGSSTAAAKEAAKNLILGAVTKPVAKAKIIGPVKFTDRSSVFWEVVYDLPLGSDAWVAGGALRRWREGGYAQLDGDIDVFGSTVGFVARMTDKCGPGEHRNGTVIWKRATKHGPVTVQFILFRMFSSPQVTIQAFDFTINQAALDVNANLFASVEFEKDVDDRLLRPVNGRTLRSFIVRLQKFIQAGYYIDERTLTECVEKLSGLPSGKSAQDYWDDTAYVELDF